MKIFISAILAIIVFQSMAPAEEALVPSDTIVCHFSDESLLGKTAIRNLICEEFCLEKYHLATQEAIEEFSSRINKIIASKMKSYNNIDWEISGAYNIRDYDNVFIIYFKNPAFVHDFIEVIYSKSHNQLYIPQDMEPKILNALLGPLRTRYRDGKEMIDGNLIDSYSILRYCRIFTIFKNISYRVIFPSSMNELFMDDFYKPVTIVSLADSVYYRKFELHLPIIRQDGNEILVEFNLTKDNKIFEVEIIFEGKIIVDYFEKEIGEIPNWNIGE